MSTDSYRRILPIWWVLLILLLLFLLILILLLDTTCLHGGRCRKRKCKCPPTHTGEFCQYGESSSSSSSSSSTTSSSSSSSSSSSTQHVYTEEDVVRENVNVLRLILGNFANTVSLFAFLLPLIRRLRSSQSPIVSIWLGGSSPAAASSAAASASDRSLRIDFLWISLC